jgi:outer membrane protein assembly factor BamD (BamD/ComL family)
VASLAGIVVTGCSTRKNTWTRRAFHNVTAHYNGWWNGNESLKEGDRELNKTILDNYNKILPVYNYGDEKMGSSLASFTDRAIEKGSMVAQSHTMWFDNREYCNWVPQSYFLIGKAYFYKHELQSARMTFDFMIKKYHYDPIQYEAMLWLAKTYIELQNFQKAETYLDMLSSKMGKEKMEDYLDQDIKAVFADLYIKQGNPEKAIPFIKESIFKIRAKNLNTRLVYILAQIYQETENPNEAVLLYKQVLQKNTDYRMTFNAKINLAKLYDSESSDSKELVKSLTKMLKDFKNQKFLDQIYYALGEVALEDKQPLPALEYFRKSVALSVENDFQKAVSSLAAAELYYNRKDYINSGAYYDTAIMFLPADYPDYTNVKRMTTTVSELVNQMKVVQLQDSLQALAALPRPQLDAIIDSIIAEIEKEEERAREDEQMRQQAIAMGAQNRVSMSPGGAPVGGGWYFYNPQAMSMGYTEFIGKWGTRKLEDNWRLSNKQEVLAMDDESEEGMATDSLRADSTATGGVAMVTNPKDKNFYLQNIPLDDEKMAKSKEKISQALYHAGFIYKEGLQKNQESIETFEEFYKRNAVEHELSIQVYFQLYLLNKDQGNEAQAQVYKDLIVNLYPESDYAKLLLDPEYFKELQKKHHYLADLYEKTYQAYEKGQYTMVVYNSDQAFELNRKDELIPKFLYLKAISMAKTDVVDSMTVNLTKLIKNYPNSEVVPLAENILTNLGLFDADTNLSPEELLAKEQMESALLIYTINKESEHYFILLVDGSQVNVNAVKIRISDFQRKSYSLDNLNISSLIFNSNWHMITVNRFPTAENAMLYYRNILASVYVFPEGELSNYKPFIISLENYPKLYQDKDVEKYLKLFEKEYLK